jgi:hypothetical protein
MICGHFEMTYYPGLLSPLKATAFTSAHSRSSVAIHEPQIISIAEDRVLLQVMAGDRKMPEQFVAAYATSRSN